MMAHQHMIVEKLHKRRLDRHLTIHKLAVEANVSRNSIANHENKKFPALATLDRWAQALGYKVVLVDMDDEWATDWHLYL